MKVAGIFADVAAGGQALHGNEAQVMAVPGFDAPRRAWFGIDIERHPVAYFEVPPDTVTSFSVSKTISVLTLDVTDLAGDRLTTVKLTCHEAQLAEVFYSFLEDVLERLDGSRSVTGVITACAADWRSLLQIAGAPLSESAAAGLYGELRFLEDAVRALGPVALETWQRSERDVHDFIADGARVEVKTSAFQNRAAVTVHGLKQLEPPQGATLTLAVAEVQRHGGETLDSVVERLLELGVERDVLVDKLAGAKYVIGMPGASEHTFSLLSWRCWEIDEGTPVLNASALPAGVSEAISSVTYSLDLGSLGAPAEAFDHHRLISTSEFG